VTKSRYSLYSALSDAIITHSDSHVATDIQGFSFVLT